MERAALAAFSPCPWFQNAMTRISSQDSPPAICPRMLHVSPWKHLVCMWHATICPQTARVPPQTGRAALLPPPAEASGTCPVETLHVLRVCVSCRFICVLASLSGVFSAACCLTSRRRQRGNVPFPPKGETGIACCLSAVWVCLSTWQTESITPPPRGPAALRPYLPIFCAWFVNSCPHGLSLHQCDHTLPLICCHRPN